MLLGLSFNEYLLFVTFGVIGLIVLVGAVVIAVGLFKARSLLRREFSAYFLSPIAYVVIVLFLLVTGHLFYLTLEQLTATGPKGVEYPLQLMLGDERFWLVFLFIPPLSTMRLFAEERSSGTLEMLMTAPLRDWQVVLCNYLACLAFYVLPWLPTLLYLPALLGAGMPRFAFVPGWTSWSQLLVGGVVYQTLYCFSVPLHFDRTFARGLIDTRPLVLYGSVALFCLFLTVRSLESRRWR